MTRQPTTLVRAVRVFAATLALAVVLPRTGVADDPSPQKPVPSPQPVPAPPPIPPSPPVPPPVPLPVDVPWEDALPPASGAPAPPASPSAPKAPAKPATIPETTRVHIQGDPRIWRMKVSVVDDRTWGVVLVGNPRVTTDDFSLKASTIVLWLDRSKSPDLASFAGVTPDTVTPDRGGTEGAGAASGPAGSRPGTAGGAGAPTPAATSAIPEALLGIYADGAVELVTGSKSFRAHQIYIDPKTNRALLVEPRFDTTMPFAPGEPEVPIHVRAARARILAKGFGIFDDADVSTSRANDRIELRVRTLTIEEYGEAAKNEPLFLGFRSQGAEQYTQHYVAREVTARGERLPLFYAPEIEFGGEKGIREMAGRFRGLSAGTRSSLGYYGFLAIGGKVGANDWLDWTLGIGGYTKRGPASTLELEWSRAKVVGKTKFFGLYDFSGEDRNDFDAGEGPRGFVEVENRWSPTSKWRVDTELNLFSDRDVNQEFFEGDFRNHKDRETYIRPRYMTGGLAATATYGFHVRPFATETIQQPEAEVWSESVPIGSRRSGFPAFDLSSAVRTGAMARHFDDDDDTPGYDAFRADAVERLYAPVIVGDVKLSPFVGLHGTGYYDRTDGGEDVTFGSVEAGLRANLQLHRDFGLYGGPWALDGLRSVFDIDAGFVYRTPSGVDRDEVPFFDEVEDADRDTELTLEVRHRVETRRMLDDVRRNATLSDLRIRADFWPDEKGPYGRTGPGQVEGWLMAEVFPQKVWLTANALASFGGPEMRKSSTALLYAPTDDFSVAAGLRFIRGDVMAPWFDTYWKWNEKWALRVGGIADLDRGNQSGAYRIGLLRFSDDHAIHAGVTVRDDGKDIGFYFDLMPAIGGTPLRPPFDPRDPVDITP